jgi:hypothetical protein
MLSYPEQAQALAQRLKADGNLHLLTPDHWLVIHDYLIHRHGLLASAKIETSQRLAKQVSTLLQLPDLDGVAKPSSEVLLEAVYWANRE